MDSIIVCRNSQGIEVRATVLRMSRHSAVFEVYNPYSILQLSEVLRDFQIIINDRLMYFGRAVVSNLVNTGIVLLCEATLDEAWLDVDLFGLFHEPKKLQDDFTEFLKGWEKIHAVLPEFKVVIADMQTLLMDLQRWLEQVEFGIRSIPSGNRSELEREVIQGLEEPLLPAISSLFTSFEEIAKQIDPDLHPVHRNYIKRQIHPLVLCSPFAYRTFHKPLGYAGDYEMVNMILRNPLEGSSLFAKTVNLWFLNQAPSEAHRNRVKYLTGLLAAETRRVARLGRHAGMTIANRQVLPCWTSTMRPWSTPERSWRKYNVGTGATRPFRWRKNPSTRFSKIRPNPARPHRNTTSCIAPACLTISQTVFASG
jgi:extracellular factor (EF) 3-hydroxypalmitic acid methyl ester biosynthesis protein